MKPSACCTFGHIHVCDATAHVSPMAADEHLPWHHCLGCGQRCNSLQSFTHKQSSAGAEHCGYLLPGVSNSGFLRTRIIRLNEFNFKTQKTQFQSEAAAGSPPLSRLLAVEGEHFSVASGLWWQSGAQWEMGTTLTSQMTSARLCSGFCQVTS